jgi:hypothetical protein
MKTVSERAPKYDRPAINCVADIHTNPSRFVEPFVTLYDTDLASYVAVAMESQIAAITDNDILRQPFDAIEYVDWFIGANIL